MREKKNKNRKNVYLCLQIFKNWKNKYLWQRKQETPALNK